VDHELDDGRAERLLQELAVLEPRDRRREEIKAELVVMHTALARYIAGRYARRGEPQEDVEQAAMVGLIKAINRYDPEVGERFVSYAAPTMTGEVKRHFRDRTWTMRMPRRLQELRLSLSAARQDFTREHGRAPTVPEIAALLGVTEEEAVEVIGATDAYRPVSLDSPVADEEGSESIGDLIGDDDPELDLVIDRNSLRPLLEDLPERERMILIYRFFGNKTQTEIAELLDISQMHVSRLITRSLAALRRRLLEER
jgi:RNA polymerase sigma-B factor